MTKQTITRSVSTQPVRYWLITTLLTFNSYAFASDSMPASVGFGLDGLVPENRWAMRLTVLHNGYTQKYDGNGQRVDLDSGVDGVNLDQSVVPGLAPLGASASLGSINLNTKINTEYTELLLGYGITNNLTFGVIVPYTQTRTHANFSISGGNVGFNPSFDSTLAISATNYPFVPADASIPPVGTEGVQQILTDPAYGYNYKRLASTRAAGLSDPTIGLLWRAYQSPIDSLILGTGVRFGLAPADDPDNLLDVPISGGANTLRTRLEYFRDLGLGFDIHFLAENFQQLPDTRLMRVPPPGAILATAASKETLRRDLGDYQEYDVELGYHWGNWRTSATWHRFVKSNDQYTAPSGADTSALSNNTGIRANQARISLGWSGIDAWKSGVLPLPLIVKLEMQETVDAINFVKVRDIYLRLTSFF